MGSGELDLIVLLRNAGFVVQCVLFLLLFFSVTSWAIIIVKFRYIRRAFIESDEFMDAFWESRDFAIAYEETEDYPGSPVARIFRAGYSELRKSTRSAPAVSGSSEIGEFQNGESEKPLSSHFGDLESVKRSVRRSINMEVTRMSQMVPFLATTGNTAPFIGLFGTVWGIMNSFHNIGKTGSANLAAVAPGISEALIATAAGLAVAIPAVIAFNYFMQKIRLVDSELQNFYADFINIIERDFFNGKSGR